MNTLRRLSRHMVKAVAAGAVLVAAALPIAVATEAGAATLASSTTYVLAGHGVATVTANSASVGFSDASSGLTLAVNDLIVVSAGLPAGDTIGTVTNQTTLVMNQAATAAASSTYVATVYAPSATIGAGANSGEIVLTGGTLAASDVISSNAAGITFGTPAVNTTADTKLQVSFTTTAAFVTGTYNLTDTNASGTAVTLTNALAVAVAPTVTSVTPATAANNVANTGLQLTINGSGFEGSTSYAPLVVLTSDVDGTQLYGSSTWNSAAQLVATFSLAGTTPPTSGGYTVTVINADGGTGSSAAAAFALAGPAITSLTPSSIAIPSTAVGSTTTEVTMLGSGFVQGAYVKVQTAAVPTTFVSATELQFAVTVPSTFATPALESVEVINPDGSSATSDASTSGGLGIGEASAGVPTVTSVSAPASIGEGGSATFTVFGTGFGPANSASSTTLTFYPAYGKVADGELACTAGTHVNVISDTELTCLVSAGSGVTAGPHSLIVTNAGGGSSVAFKNALTVTGPTITSVTPALVGAGATTAITVVGSGFSGTATFGTETYVSSTTPGSISSPTSTSFVFTPSQGYVAGANVITVQNGTAGAYTEVQVPLTVGGSTITISSVTLPNAGTAVGAGATSVPITFNGAGFLTGASIVDTTDSANVTFTVTTVTPTAITGTVTVAAGDTATGDIITVTNPDGGFGTDTLTIDAGPTIASLTPYSALAGKVTTVTIVGSGFLPTSTVTSGSTLVKVGTVKYVSSTELTVSLTVSPITGTSAINVALNVVNVDNGTASTLLGVNAGPTVTGTYTVPNPSTNAEVVVTGTGFEYGMTASSANPAYTVSVGSVTLATSTTPASAVLLVTTTASTEAAITLTNPDGGTTTFNLNAPAVTPPPPVTTGKKVPFTHGTSGSAVVGKTVILTISGGNFYGQPRLTSNEGGTRAVVSKDSGTSLTVRITVRGGSAAGEHTLTITLADGKSCKANYRVIK